jgi:hypothetical protein
LCFCKNEHISQGWGWKDGDRYRLAIHPGFRDPWVIQDYQSRPSHFFVCTDIVWPGELRVLKLTEKHEREAYQLVPHGVLNLAGPIPLRAFVEEWNLQSSTDAGLYNFYSMLSAPYKYLKHCHLLEVHLMKTITNFTLVQRGSVKHHVALKGGADIDLDIILPLSFCSCEDMSKILAKENNLQDHEIGPYETIREVTRSLEFKMTAHTFEVEVDLFPKFINKDGLICSLSPMRDDGLRHWILVDLLGAVNHLHHLHTKNKLPSCSSRSGRKSNLK